MTVSTVALLNHKGGVGKTSLVYHLAWMYADLGYTVLAVDLDPQADLTGRFLGEDRAAQLADGQEPGTIHDALRSLLDAGVPRQFASRVAPDLYLLAGNLALSSYEDELARDWQLCLAREERAFRVTTAIWRLIQGAAEQAGADIALIDLGSNLGALNRAALIATDHVVIPLATDQISLQGLGAVGSALRQWRDGWRDRVARNPEPALSLPPGRMAPAGYTVLQQVVRLDRPGKPLEHWLAQIPRAYAAAVLDDTTSVSHPNSDPHCLGILKRYDSLMMLSQEAHKPMFHLKASDGALGSHARAVLAVRTDFEALARKLEASSWKRPLTSPSP